MSTFQRKRVNWRWIDGELQTFNFNAWADGEPNNDGGGGYCALYEPRIEAWKDEKCFIYSEGIVCQDVFGK